MHPHFKSSREVIFDLMLTIILFYSIILDGKQLV